jgi:hypothetical protein
VNSRFVFEQQIMDCWGVCDDIKTIAQITDIRDMSHDELLNILIGLQTLYQMKFEILFNTFEQMIQEGQIK